MQCSNEVGKHTQDESGTAELNGPKEPLEALEDEASTTGTSHPMQYR